MNSYDLWLVYKNDRKQILFSQMIHEFMSELKNRVRAIKYIEDDNNTVKNLYNLMKGE